MARRAGKTRGVWRAVMRKWDPSLSERQLDDLEAEVFG